MATTKPRITITLDQDVYDTLKGLAEVQGCSMSAVVGEFLTMVNPIQKRVLRAARKALNLEADSKASTVKMLEAAEAQLTAMLGPLLELFDGVEAAIQPPHSNTGVTTPNPPPPPNPKKPAKRRSRAVGGEK
ncbi:hypothetical protein FQZ97_790930 [compost metagenome]